MKKTIIGGVLAIIGTLGHLAVIIIAAKNIASEWSTPPGRLLSTVCELGMLGILFIFFAILITGLVVLGIEYFKKG